MDYMYNFKQAHNDRLENAGIKTYRTNDGIRFSAKNTIQQVRVLLTTITGLISR